MILRKETETKKFIEIVTTEKISIRMNDTP